MEDALKQVLEDIATGTYRRDLFLFEKEPFLQQFKLQLANISNELGLSPIFTSMAKRIAFDNGSFIQLATAYPEISFRFAGMSWTAIHGLETLNKYPEHAEGDKARFRAQVRKVTTAPSMREIVETALKNLQNHKAVRGKRYKFTDAQAAEVCELALVDMAYAMEIADPTNAQILDLIESSLKRYLAPYRIEVKKS